MNVLKIVRSSAGSGKTYALVKEYLGIVLKNPPDYKHTLAITFTNKATAEMKSRIIEALVDLSDGKTSHLSETLRQELKLTDLQERARKALDFILHDYSSFSVCTIDSFFQTVIRGIAREIDLPIHTQIDLNEDEIKEEIIDALFEDVGKDAQLTQWVTELFEQSLMRDGKWNIHPDLVTIAGELFKPHEQVKSFDKEEIREVHSRLNKIKTSFESELSATGKKALTEIKTAGFTINDFSNKAKGPAGYFEKIASKKNSSEKYTPNQYVTAAVEDADKWVAKSSAQREAITPLVKRSLMPMLNEALDAYNKRFTTYLSAVTLLRRIYLLGIFNDLAKKLAQYRAENNVMLLSDTTRLLNRFITGNDTSFIYEKTGSRFKHFLIDEFQDTSAIQWKNLLPLVINSLGSGHTTMVVGDAKQSIYRWRGGSTKLLSGELKKDLKSFDSITIEENLETNFRSRKDVVEFNNLLFSAVPALAKEAITDWSGSSMDFYSNGLVQKVADKNNGPGYVNIRFLEKPEADSETENGKWQEQSLTQMLATIRQLQERGYSYGDIAIIVRANKDGNKAAMFLAENGITDVVSPDSLLIRKNPKVIFLINIFRFLADTGNHIARSKLLHYYSILSGKADINIHQLFTDFAKNKSKKSTPGLFDTQAFEKNLFNNMLPPEFSEHIPFLSKLPLYEMAEQVVKIFKLDNPDAFIQRFLDLILEYSAHQSPALPAFLEWWDESKQADKCSVVIPEGGNAIRIITIHKAKGLQFPVVLMPFCEWKFDPKPEDLIWVKADEMPFSEFGELPMHPKADLVNTVFRKSYTEEVIHSFVDSINMLYVAFTRAEEQLYAWTPSPKSEGLKTCSSLIMKSIMATNHLRENYSEETSTFKYGKEDLISKMREPVSLVKKQKEFEKGRWQQHLTIRAKNREFSENKTGQKTPVERGLLIHNILSVLYDSTQLDKVLQQFIFEGLMNEAEKDELQKELKELLSNEEIKEFFMPGKNILNERELLLPGGKILRPDRVIIDGKTAIVIDFKTGEEDGAHAKQVKEYSEEIRNMGFEMVHSYILYLKYQKLVSV